MARQLINKVEELVSKHPTSTGVSLNTKSDKRLDIIFDAVGKTTFSQCKNLLAGKGKYLQAGITLKVFLSVFWTSMLSTKKALIMATGLRPPAERTKDLNFITELVQSGKIKPIIDKILHIEKIVEAHQYVDTGRKKGNVVVTINEK